MTMKTRIGVLTAVLVHLVVVVWLMHNGTLYDDEGWYLVAARKVAQGQVPYRDFAFFQAPWHPTVYGLVGSVYGLLGAGTGFRARAVRPRGLRG